MKRDQSQLYLIQTDEGYFFHAGVTGNPRHGLCQEQQDRAASGEAIPVPVEAARSSRTLA